MSLELTELADAMVTFPPGKNVRVKITGLALCKFTAALSTIRFLRHVRHHELTMKITQMRSDMTNPKTFTVKIEPTQNVDISASTITTVASHVFDQNLDHLIKMKSFLHDNRPLRDKGSLPSPNPTWLKLNHCAFYTHQLTVGKYKFEDVEENLKPTGEAQQYCQVLGGYLSYSGNLTISILSDGIPLVFPLTDFLYEIEFSNSCDTSPGCKDEEDFRFMYDIVRENGNPGRVFKLVKIVEAKAVDTGACLPVCEDC